MLRISIELKYEDRASDKFYSGNYGSTLDEWAINADEVKKVFGASIDNLFISHEGDISAEDFLNYVGHNAEEAKEILGKREVVYPIPIEKIDGITSFVRKFYEDGYDKVLSSVYITLTDTF